MEDERLFKNKRKWRKTILLVQDFTLLEVRLRLRQEFVLFEKQETGGYWTGHKIKMESRDFTETEN